MKLNTRYIIGFRKYDGTFSCIVKNRNFVGFNTEEEAKEEIKKLQPKYKHELRVEVTQYLTNED